MQMKQQGDKKVRFVIEKQPTVNNIKFKYLHLIAYFIDKSNNI